MSLTSKKLLVYYYYTISTTSIVLQSYVLTECEISAIGINYRFTIKTSFLYTVFRLTKMLLKFFYYITSSFSPANGYGKQFCAVSCKINFVPFCVIMC